MHIVLYVVYLAAIIYGWLIVARALLSWFPLRPGNTLYQARKVSVWLTEPYLRLFRRIVPSARIGTVGLDLSAMVGLIVLFVVVQIVARL